MNSNSYCLILAGGIGNRFWPVSNKLCPKQFSDILNTGKSFIRQTYERVSHLFDNQHIFIITGSEYETITHEQIPEIPTEHILKEPIRRNTATCITYASFKIRKINPDATMVVVPSDHFITNDQVYLNDLQDGINFVQAHGGLLTIGICPSRAETEYGYIQVKSRDIQEKIVPVKTFTEKPDIELARKFLESGDFLWNAGIFIWQAGDIIKEIKAHLYDLYSLFQDDSALNTSDEQSFINQVYGQCPNLPIDVGIMEKSSCVSVLKGQFGWSDVGTWHAFHSLCENDGKDNVSNSPKVVFQDSRDCIVNVPKNKKVVIQGVDNLIIAEKNNYLMICHRKDERQIRHFEKLLKYKK